MSDLTKTTDEQMYQMLFRAIHEHYLKPDTHLPEDELAKSFNVSRTRVRKILQRLIYEQLVVQLPNRGCFVASMGKPQVNEIFTTRKILELGVIDLLELPLNTSQINTLNKICDAEIIYPKNMPALADYSHTCEHCGYMITESEFCEIGDKQYV